MSRVWIRDEQVQELEDLSINMISHIRQLHREARRRLHLTDPEFDTSRLDRL